MDKVQRTSLSDAVTDSVIAQIVAWVFIYSQVPETKNRSLEEIEASFRGTATAAAGRAS